MSSLSQGHVTNVEYTHGYYGELNPVRAAFALAYAGIAAPEVTTACELGFGQGVSVSLHVAAQSAQWWGTDFNPQHTAFARGLADDAEQAARLAEQGFAEFCARDDLPDFDFIGVHGVWTWISEDNQNLVIDFVRRKLRPGGALYVSYNTFPGWSDLAPLRHLLKGHVDTMGAPGQALFGRIDASLAFMDQLAATNPFYLRSAPRSAERLASLKTQNKNYVAHEYLTDHWNVTYYADFAKRMAAAKVAFACSANPLDTVDMINLTPDQQALLKGLTDTDYRESIRDFCINQQFRRDIWVKGAMRLTDIEQVAAVRRQRVVMNMPRSAVTLTVKGALGEATLHPEVYDPLLDYLADGTVRTISEVEAAGRAAGVEPQKVLAAMPILVGMGILQVAQDPAATAAATPACARVNNKIIARADVRPEIAVLASPVTGGAVLVGRFEQLFLGAIAGGATTPREWAEQAWARLAAVGQSLLKDGQTLPTAEDNLAELTIQAEAFAAVRLPLLRAVGIAST